MVTQDVINAVNSLSGSIDSLNRAGEKEAIKTVTKKLLELIERL